MNGDQFWDLLTPDCVIIDNTGKRFKREEYRQFMEEFLSAHTDYHLVIEHVIA